MAARPVGSGKILVMSCDFCAVFGTICCSWKKQKYTVDRYIGIVLIRESHGSRISPKPDPHTIGRQADAQEPETLTPATLTLTPSRDADVVPVALALNVVSVDEVLSEELLLGAFGGLSVDR